jgi:putative ABC transport system permease protein
VSSRRSLRDGLVVAELALATMVLVGAGLMLHSFSTLTSVDPGFETESLFALRVRIPQPTTVAQINHLREIEAGIAAIAGVSSVGSTFIEPFTGFGTGNRTAAVDRKPQSPDEFTFVAWRSVTPNYFETLQIPLHAGEVFSHEPVTDDRPVAGEMNRDGGATIVSGPVQEAPTPLYEQRGYTPVVISQALADIEWPGQNAVGKQLHWSRMDGDYFTVAAVVGDVRDTNLASDGVPVVYRLFDHRRWTSMSVLYRVDGDAVGVSDAVRATLRAIDPGMPTPDIRLVGDNMASSMSTPRFLARLFGAFGVLALLLAATGVYGLLSFHVAQRTREIGVRIALGAERLTVVGMVVREGMTRVWIGLSLGVVGALVLGRLLAGLLYEIAPSDPVTLVSVTLLLASVAFLATLFPALRAGRMDPTVAFRED